MVGQEKKVKLMGFARYAIIPKNLLVTFVLHCVKVLDLFALTLGFMSRSVVVLSAVSTNQKGIWLLYYYRSRLGYSLSREVAVDVGITQEEAIGGPGCVVEIDESKFGKSMLIEGYICC